MLADLTLLLHEVTDALRGRRDGSPAADPPGRRPGRPTLSSSEAESPRAVRPIPGSGSLAVLLTGTISPGKARLLAALERALAPSGIAVASPGRGAVAGHALHVHAEADIDALLETGPGTEGAWARRADLIVPVDWEPTPHSVRRVIAALVARGLDVLEAGS
jgi:hypothetical protein